MTVGTPAERSFRATLAAGCVSSATLAAGCVSSATVGAVS
jgi:hypothetical protein